MSFSDAIGQIDQIVQWEQQLANPAALTQTSSTGATTATTSTDATTGTSQSSFASALSAAQADTESSAATSVLDPSSDTSAATSTDGTSGTSDLLGGGDSQLLAALQSMTSADATDTTDGTDATDTTGATDTTDPLADLSQAGSTDSSDSTQELLAALQSSEAADATDTTDGTDAADPMSDFTSMDATDSTDPLVAALESATTQQTAATQQTVATSDSGAAGGVATSASDPRIQSMTEEANALVGKPYVWGGGHDGWGPSTGYDCSGFVSAVLHAGGYLSSPQDTATLPSAAGMESGPGQYVTVYDRDQSGQEGHTIIDINGQFYESGGEQGSWGGGGGVEKISTPTQAYLNTFNVVLHPAGL